MSNKVEKIPASTLEKISYKEASVEDLTKIVALHKKTFHKNFTSQLGSGFLIQYYRLFLNTDFLLLIAKKESEIVGFIAGVNNYRVLSNAMKKNKYLFVFPLLRSLINPQLIPHIARKIYGFSFNDRVNALPCALNDYNEITSFAVNKQKQGLGIGSQLLKHYLEKLNTTQTKQMKKVFITTDANNNDPTINFYQKNGFCIRHRYYQTSKREMLLMINDCS